MNERDAGILRADSTNADFLVLTFPPGFTADDVTIDVSTTDADISFCKIQVR